MKKLFKTLGVAIVMLVIAFLVAVIISLIEYFCPIAVWLLAIIIMLFAAYSYVSASEN